MELNDIFQSKYLIAADLKGQARTLTIQAATAEVIGSGEQAGQKLVMQLATPEGQLLQKRLVCNRTNARSIAMGYGTKIDMRAPADGSFSRRARNPPPSVGSIY